MASRFIIKGIAGILYLVKTILKTILKQNKKCPKKCPKQNEKLNLFSTLIKALKDM